MRSMTGFGAGSAPLAGGRLTVEIRALNHKHQEVRVRVPAELHDYSFFLEQVARELLGRGRFDIALRAEGGLDSEPTIDESRLRALHRTLTDLAREVDPDATVDIAQLLTLQDMVKLHGPEPEMTRGAIRTAFSEAAKSLSDMQELEGQTLREDLRARLLHLTQIAEQIADGAMDLLEYRRQKLKERLDHLLVDVAPVSPERLEHEIALLADRSDITEELVRLRSHFGQFTALLEDPNEVGRRLDFLLQEVSREVNTVGAKSPHTKVAQLVVEMKSEVERLREQVQNVA